MNYVSRSGGWFFPENAFQWSIPSLKRGTFHERSLRSFSSYYYCYDGRINLTTDCTPFCHFLMPFFVDRNELEKRFTKRITLSFLLFFSLFASYYWSLRKETSFSRGDGDIDGEKASRWKLLPVKRATRALTPRILKDPAYLRRNDKSEGNFNRGKVGALCDLRGANGWTTRWPIIIIERDILLPRGREETTGLKSRGDCLKVNELESNARGALSPSSRRIETRALDDFRVIEHVHSFSRREDFDDRAVCFDTNDDDAIPHAHSDE